MQNYKSLCAAVTICGTLVNIQTDTHRQRLTRFSPLVIFCLLCLHRLRTPVPCDRPISW